MKYFGGGGGGGGGAVSSVFGRAGAVVAALGDYAASLVNNDSSVSGATVKDALNALATSIAGVVTSFKGRTGAVVPAVNDYTASQVQNTSTVAGSEVSDALNTLGLGSLVRGPNLSGTVDTTVTRDNGVLYVMLAGQTTALRNVICGTGGAVAPVNGFNFVFLIFAQANDVHIQNGGPAGTAGMDFTVPAGKKMVVYGQFDSINYFQAGATDINP